MIVLGADTHKSSHTIAAINAATGQLLGDKTVAVGARGFAALVIWARGLDGELVWALEDCRHVSGALERFLIARGERVVRVSTRLMAGTRRSSRERGKSDQIDAVSVSARCPCGGNPDAADGGVGGPGARHPPAGRPSRAPGPHARRAQQHAAVEPSRPLARAFAQVRAQESRSRGAPAADEFTDNASTATTKTRTLDAGPRHRYGRTARARFGTAPRREQ